MSLARPALPVALKIFLTCWTIFVLHFATDIVREHYLSFSLAEDYAFRMDKYLGLHVDIFETPGYGAHIGNNPGASMLGAIPYWIVRPIISSIVDRVNARRFAGGPPNEPVYDDPRPRRVEFYKTVYERGLDVQFGLAALVILMALMAPASGLAAVAIFWLFDRLGSSRRQAILLAFLYGLGTPVFFRTAFLNQNLLIAHFVLFGFLVLWKPAGWPAWSARRSAAAAGFLGGFSLLSDYSGGLVLAWLGLYAVWPALRGRDWPRLLRTALWYAGGAAGPIALLLFYQWKSFGSPWYPGQHYMPPVEWIDIGYQGVGWPEAELFWMLLFDLRFGLFVACPLLLFGLLGMVQALRRPTWLPAREAWFLIGFTAAFVLFFSTVQYTRLQWVTGVRYLVPVIPCLFLLSVVALQRLPGWARFVVIVLAFAESWALSMARAISIPESLAQVFFGGFQLPWLNVLSKMAEQYVPFLAQGTSPIPLFLLCGVLIWGLWQLPEPEAGRQPMPAAVDE